VTRLPWKATLCLTYACNLRCGFCRIWERRPKGELTFDEWTRILERSPRFLWIDLTGGEPTVRGPSIETVTTTRALHDRMRGVEGSFERCVESIRILRDEGVTVAAGMTVTAENESAAPALLAELERLIPGFSERDLHVNLAQVSEHYYGNSKAMFTEARGIPGIGPSVWPPAAAIQSWLERRYRRLIPAFLSSRKTPMPCRSLEASVFVSPMGLVHPCITDPRVAGDLRACDYDLKGILEGEEARRLRREIAAGRCPHCWTPCEAYPTIIESVPGAGIMLRSL
jgi:MoaA/NifB/PqqE/SkfB family radical SAM enzyme